MKGLELSRNFYEGAGAPMLRKEFPELLERIAVGLAGEGSECFGFDDALSADHDFEPAFCLWLTDEDYERYGFRLEKAYASLPAEWEGYRRQPLSAVGGSRHGVMRTSDFYRRFLGTPTSPESEEQWLYLPSSSLACAAGGEIFRDDLGSFSAVRDRLREGYPMDIRLKKLAGHAVMAVQSGLYNYERCLRRCERGAAQLAVFEFVRHTVSMVYLLNNAYEPFYKWAYRGMRELPLLSWLESPLVALTEMGNEPEEARAKAESMEEIAASLCQALWEGGFCKENTGDLERQAYALQDRIVSPSLRNMHVMAGV